MGGIGVPFSRPRQLETSDDLLGFHCGAELVDGWLRRHAAEAKENGTGVVYVSFRDGLLAGFYCISSYLICRGQINGGWLKRNAPNQVPAILFGMLGVDERFQGMHLGELLLRDAYMRAREGAQTIGARALIVDPLDEVAARFYARYGFEVVPGTDSMYIPLHGSSHIG